MFFFLSDSSLVGIYLEVVCEDCEIEMEQIEKSTFNINVTIIKFKFSEFPSNMKMLAFLAGELPNNAK